MTIKQKDLNFEGTRELVKHVLSFVRGKTLDLGAGTAKYKPIISEKSDEYIAFDLCPGEHIDRVGCIINTCLEEASFDTIFCTQVLEHISTPWMAMKEIRRLLKVDGICIVTAPFLQAYHADPHDYFRYTTEGIQSLCANEGFEILESGVYGRLFFVLFDFIKLLWFNPYTRASKKGSVFIKFMIQLANFLDRFVKNRIIYGNVYVVAKKLS